jgi:nucleotide-binding universal stress UspA family protein
MTALKTYSKSQDGKEARGSINTILFPTDFSPTAHNAFKYAIQVADQLGAKILLLHVYQDTPVNNDYIPREISDSIQEEKLEKAMHSFHEYQREALFELGKTIEVNPILQAGRPETEIVSLSRKMNIDLIIMGTMGAASISEKILGSVTAKVIENAKCPVLAIPGDCIYEPITQILYGMQMAEDEFPIIDQLVDITNAFDAKLICAHVKTSKNASWNKLELESFEELYHLEKEGRLDFYLFNHNDVLRGLQKFMSEYRVDMLAMTTHKRDFLAKMLDKSLTKEMVLYTDVPLLAFHR